jgi:hypothetical protein
MGTAAFGQSLQTVRALREDIQDADDRKIRQIVALLDGSPENQVLQQVLDPLRPRLATLKPTRSLRFARLLFMPLHDLIVPAPEWRPGRPSIPRSVLKSMSNIVRIELGSESETIERTCGGHDTGDTEVVSRAGDTLWCRAGEILAKAVPPADWGKTGLRPSNFAPLAQGIATVLRRASLLRRLVQDAELGVLEPDEQAICGVISDMASEPLEGRAMVFKLILGRLPRAVPLLRRLVASSRMPAEKMALQTAMECGTEDILSDMESQSGLTDSMRDGPLAAVGTEVQRIDRLLQDISEDSNAVRHRARVNEIREKLDAHCRGRFVDGMKKGLVTPLATAGPVDSAVQTQLEICARDLRTVEMAGRKLGSPTTYDALLFKASEAVQAAADSGSLGTMRAIRLVEILSGPETAEAMYKMNAKSASRVT